MKTKLFLIGLLVIIGLSANAQWQTTNGPYSGDAIQCLITNRTNLFCGTNSAGAFAYNGTSWNGINTGLTISDISALAVSGTDVFAGGDVSIEANKVFLSTNNGGNWTEVDIGLPNSSPYEGIRALAINGTDIYAGINGGSDGGVALSTNNGSTWSTLSGSGIGNGGVYSIDFIGGNILAGVYGGEIELSADNGITWTFIQVDPFATGGNTYALATSGTNVFAGVYQHGVFMSSDTGNTWTAVNSSLPGNNSVYAFAIDGSNIFAGSDSGVFVTYNNGNLWTAVNTGLPSPKAIYSLAIYGTDLYAGTGTQGVWKRALSEIESGVNNLSNKNSQINIYPNPFSNKATIKIQATEKIINGELRMYDLQEQEVKTINNISGQQITIDRNGLINGIYFIRLLEDNKTIWTGKIVITD